MNDPDGLIQKLGLKEHPEGGLYREIYRSPGSIGIDSLPAEYDRDHCYGTSIYFMLRPGECSKLHRLRTDELWHFYEGSPLNVIIFQHDVPLKNIILGPDIYNGQNYQGIIEKGAWFGAYQADPHRHSLIGCTMAPGFEFADFEIAGREKLIREFPDYSDIIIKLT